MFGSTSSFGQPSSSLFGSQSVFGQANNPFTPKPFGSASPFGSQTGGSVFGGTSTGVVGATQSSTPTFVASSSSAFGSSVPPFGACSTPAFGSGSSSFGGSSLVGQKPAFGGFGSTPGLTQANPFGGTLQQIQSAFGSNIFDSYTTFGASGQPAFGSTSTPAFGAPSIPSFGFTTTPMFGSASTPVIGSTSTSAFGSTGSTLGVSNAPAFGSGVFGMSSAPAFGSSTTSAFGAYSTPAFGSSSTPVFSTSSTIKASSSPSYGFGSSPSFGQSNSTFGSQAPTPALVSTGFGQPAFGGQRGGSKVTRYSPTPEEVDGSSRTQPAGKLGSISAMPVYRDKSHEELRCEDYQLGDKVIGGPSTVVQPATQSSPFGVSSIFGQPSTNPFPSNPSSFGSTPSSSPFTPSSTGIGSISSPPPQIHHPSNPSPVGTSSPFGVSRFPLISVSNPAPRSAFRQNSSGLFNTQSVGVLQSNPPSLGQTNSSFGHTGSAFSQTTSSFGQPNPFSTSSTFGGNACSISSTPSILSTSNQTAQPAPTSNAFSLGNIGQTQAGGFASISGAIGQGAFTQFPTAVVMQPTPVSNPFGSLPVMPQMSIGRSGSLPSVQYGISSRPVTDKPALVRVSPLLTSRHLYQRRSTLPARKYNPRNDAPKVPFYYEDEEAPITRKEDPLFIPRDNPRALVICPSVDKSSPLKNTYDSVHRDDGVAENGSNKEYISNQKANGDQENHSSPKTDSYSTLTGHRAGEASFVYEHGADVEALMPKLKHTDYYTEPWIQELAAKERVEPGFCQHVKNFVVGRHGYGSIKFIGETDVRRLDLESLVQFNNREVIVYMDDSKKPPVGQGLNKPAEVTLLNIKCFEKKTRQQYTEGPKLEKYKEMLMKKTQEQDAEFVSYDPLEGEWTFRVKHFSRYALEVEDEVELDVQ